MLPTLASPWKPKLEAGDEFELAAFVTPGTIDDGITGSRDEA